MDYQHILATAHPSIMTVRRSLWGTPSGDNEKDVEGGTLLIDIVHPLPRSCPHPPHGLIQAGTCVGHNTTCYISITCVFLLTVYSYFELSDRHQVYLGHFCCAHVPFIYIVGNRSCNRFSHHCVSLNGIRTIPHHTGDIASTLFWGIWSYTRVRDGGCGLRHSGTMS